MPKSKTLIEKQSRRKSDSELTEALIQSKKNEAWKDVAQILSGPSRKRPIINLGELNESVEDGKTLVVPGKVLSEGSFESKSKVVALKFSSRAEEKLKNVGCETKSIMEEIKSNPNGQGLKIIK